MGRSLFVHCCARYGSMWVRFFRAPGRVRIRLCRQEAQTFACDTTLREREPCAEMQEVWVPSVAPATREWRYLYLCPSRYHSSTHHIVYHIIQRVLREIEIEHPSTGCVSHVGLPTVEVA